MDEVIKKANRDTASETVRTLLVYGYILEPPSGDAAEGIYALGHPINCFQNSDFVKLLHPFVSCLTRYLIWILEKTKWTDVQIFLNSFYHVKVALDGGTRPGDTLQILPPALAQPPNPRSITSHSVLRGHPSLTHRVGFFRGIQWGIHSQKIIIGNAICFFKKICISDEKY